MRGGGGGGGAVGGAVGAVVGAVGGAQVGAVLPGAAGGFGPEAAVALGAVGGGGNGGGAAAAGRFAAGGAAGHRTAALAGQAATPCGCYTSTAINDICTRPGLLNVPSVKKMCFNTAAV